jgi:hypothetical protein
MPSTFSTSLRIELIGEGEQSGVWGATTNNNLGELIEQAIAGRTALNVTAGNLTLTSLNGVVDEARSAVLAVTGTPGVTRVLTIPNVKKTYTVINSTANIVQIKTASGTAYDCAPLSQSYVNCDGTNVVTGRSITDGANAITSLAAPFNSPSFTGNVGIGTATPTLPLTIGDSTLPAGATIDGQMISSDVAAATALLSIRRSSASGNPGLAQFTSSGTAAVPTAVALNRGLGRNDWLGFDGTNYINAAAITTAVDGAVSTGVVPGRMVFSTSTTNTPVERMRITSSGAVGIGTTTPFTSSTTFGNTSAPLVVDGGYYGGGAYFNSTDWFNTNSSQGGWVIRNTGGVFTLWTGPSPGVAGTAFTDFAERVRVTSSGNVGIGTSTPAGSLQVVGGILARGGVPGASGVNNNGYAFTGNSGDNDSGMYSSADGQLGFYTNSLERISINTRAQFVNGSASRGATGYPITTPDDSIANALRADGYIEWQSDIGAIGTTYFSSDIRKKRNIQPSTTPALPVINAIELIDFDWAEGSGEKGHVNVGVSAQQLKTVNEQFVAELSDGSLMVRDPKIFPFLIKAIQEQQAIISAMEARLAALEA